MARSSSRRSAASSVDLHQAHDLVRREVHVPGHRAAGRALAALVALGDVDAGHRGDGLGQSGFRRFWHISSLRSYSKIALSTNLIAPLDRRLAPDNRKLH